MSIGKSIHIGLNFVDPDRYDGWNGELSGCINDANDMKRIADGLGYQSVRLIDSEATAARVTREIALAASELCDGDTLVLTYSGHGAQVDDVHGDEDDRQDETWVLWDRMLIDDELFALWSQFAAGVRIFVLSDSCHSGTVLKMRAYEKKRGAPDETGFKATAHKALPKNIEAHIQARDASVYESLQWVSGNKYRSDIGACVLLISGCQDNQLSADGAVNGLFTQTLLQVWRQGAFSGDYRDFHRGISDLMPPDQTPNLFCVGRQNLAFEAEKPFTIAGSTVLSTPVPGPRPTLRRGSSGPDVTYLQQLLVRLDFQITADGQFGQMTEASVLIFQRDNPPLIADGVVGPSTWQAIEQAAAGQSPPAVVPDVTPLAEPTPSSNRPTLRIGSNGPDVSYLQQLLRQHGYSVAVDGSFGPNTASFVRAFQASQGLTPVDGIVGPRTWAALEAREHAVVGESRDGACATATLRC